MPTQPCGESRARTSRALEAAGIANATPVECFAGWSIAIDAICRVPPISFDNNDTVDVTIVGRWIVMYEHDGIIATWKPPMYTGADQHCIDYSNPGNIAVGARDPLVTAAFHGLPDGGVSLEARTQTLQDHPEVFGVSFSDESSTTDLHVHGAQIEGKEPR